MSDTLGLLEEATDVARELGYLVREEPLGDSPGGACTVGGRKQILLNAALPAARRLDVLVDALGADPAVETVATSRLLARRLAAARKPSGAP